MQYSFSQRAFAHGNRRCERDNLSVVISEFADEIIELNEVSMTNSNGDIDIDVDEKSSQQQDDNENEKTQEPPGEQNQKQEQSK